MPTHFHLEISFKFPITFINLVSELLHALLLSYLSFDAKLLILRFYHFKGYSEFDIYQKKKSDHHLVDRHIFMVFNLLNI